MFDMTHLLFSYGTLRLPRVQQTLFGGPVPTHEDAIVGYEVADLHMPDPQVVRLSGASTHPILRPSSNPDSSVPGAVLELTDEQLQRADDYEVSAYVRTKVHLASGREAWAYTYSSEGLSDARAAGDHAT